MTDSFPSLADLAKVNNKNVADLGVTDLLNEAPFMAALAADISSNGATHSYLKESGTVSVGFRAANAGIQNSASADTQVDCTLKILDASFHVDKALADIYWKGKDAYIAREAKRHLKQAFFEAEKQFLNGTIGGASGGFTGFANLSTLSAVTGNTGTVVNASGSTALTSIYLVRTNTDGTDAMAVMGNNGEIVVDDYSTSYIETENATGSSTGRFTTYFTPIQGWLGLQPGSAYSVIRIANIESTTNKATDTLIYQALSLFPASRMPNLIVMNRRSERQIRDARTATNATGTPAPLLRDSTLEGLKVIVTDALGNAETALV